MGDQVIVVIEGSDEEMTFEQLQRFVINELPHCDAPLKAANDNSQALASPPRSFTNLNAPYLQFATVSPGFGEGQLIQVGAINFDKITKFPPTLALQEEQAQMRAGLETLHKALQAQQAVTSGTQSEVIAAHLSIVRDKEFQALLESHLTESGNCARAIIATARHFSEKLQKSASAYLRERELDIRDVCFQTLQIVYGEQYYPNQLELSGPTICIADDLTPSQFLEMDKTKLKGLLLTHGGSTSHTVILARSFGIPTVVGVKADKLHGLTGQTIIVDGDLGLVVTDISEAVQRYYHSETRVRDIIKQRQSHFLHQPAVTADGIKLEVAANIAHSVEAKAAFDNGAESVGLFRTEMLYMDRASVPNEDELYNIFCQALEAPQGKNIIIRTIDIGGDKPVDYLNIPAEKNPFLGYRAVRIYEEFLELFRTQLRAILRASAHGKLKIMIPMISSLEEILWVKETLAEIRHELRGEIVPFDERIPLGVMMEVPSLAFIIDQCCEEIDFFSIGSNDLTQYLMAVARDNAKVSRHYNSLNPAFLRTLNHIVTEVHRHGKWVGLCGELGAKGSVLPLLVGLGLDEISMSSPAIPATKEHIAKLDSHACRNLLEQAMQCKTSLEVEHLLAQFRMSQQDAPLVSTECIVLDQDLRSREEVIKTLTDNLFLAGRCRYPAKLADDVWAREDVFSTGLGFGFAIPHTKSEHIEQSTISVCRLDKPIQWGDEEAQFVIMLTLNKHSAGGQHMKIFSRLARRIMHPDFRESLFNAESPAAIAAMLNTELEIN